MTCHELIERIEGLQPEASPRDVARYSLLLTNSVDNFDELAEDERFLEAWHDMELRLQAATDQHAAMTAELEELCHLGSDRFTMENVWTLIRAIRVQSQILHLYVGEPQPA
jgi:hypothetical protein